MPTPAEALAALDLLTLDGQYKQLVEHLRNILLSSARGPDSTLVRTADIDAAKKLLVNLGHLSPEET